MPYTWSSKPDPEDENHLIIEQCTLERRCSALTTFVDHAWAQTPYRLELKRLWNFTRAKENDHLSLVFCMPQKKGNFVTFNFCPFCGGCIDPGAHKISGSRTLENGERKEVNYQISYEPFSEEDYKKYVNNEVEDSGIEPDRAVHRTVTATDSDCEDADP